MNQKKFNCSQTLVQSNLNTFLYRSRGHFAGEKYLLQDRHIVDDSCSDETHLTDH